MERRLFNDSIDDLESKYESACRELDEGVLKQLQYELTFRKSPRARELAAHVAEALNRAPESGPSFRLAQPKRPAKPASPPPAAKGRKAISHKPTDEQQQAIEAFLTGGSLKINAYAGTGKTSTLEMLAHSISKRGLYIAFNRNIVIAAKERFPSSVDCSTTHALAYHATPTEYKRSQCKMTEKVNAPKVVDILELSRNWRVDEKHTLKPLSQGSIVLKTLQNFTRSADAQFANHHVPKHGALVTATPGTISMVEEFAVEGAKQLWSRMLDPDDLMPLGHDGYLKLWALSDPIIAADFILLDEAQDTNPVVLDVLKSQSAQMICVGDRYQQIYEWRGAINAMDQMATIKTTYLSQSFRFGDEIARLATKVLSRLGERIVITGNPNLASRIGPTIPGTVLARTNALAITAIIEALDEGRKPHLVGGITELMEMLRGVEALKRNLPSTVADFFGFQNWTEVVEFANSGEGEQLLTFVKLVESRGERQLMWALNHTVEEERADLIVSTAHKAKGREWNKVRLLDDFLRSQPRKIQNSGGPQKPVQIDEAEMRLFYVALTRARYELEVAPALLSVMGMPVHDAFVPPISGHSGHPSLGHRSLPASEVPHRKPWSPPKDWSSQPNPTKPSQPVKDEPKAPKQNPGWLRRFLGC